MTEPTELIIEGFWIDPNLVLPPHKDGDVDSVDVLIYTKLVRADCFTVGCYNYRLQLWVTDLGRYEKIDCWAYIPKVSLK